MAADHMAEKRARLLASRARWSHRASEQPLTDSSTEKHYPPSIQQEEGAEPEVMQEAPGQHLKWNGSSEDDLALGVEASLYGEPTADTVQRHPRSSIARHFLPSWSSLTSAFSNQSEPLSVMDVLNLWQDDPEELLLDLGFGVEEPDVTVRIPARFINHQSKARGIDIQLFLEAQKNRIDIENPDVRNRFRQLEVLQQVTTAFSSLVGGSSPGIDRPSEPPVSAETRERRRRVGMLLRKASKMTLSQGASLQDQQPLSPPVVGPAAGPELPADPPLDRRSPVKCARQCPPNDAGLGPLPEEHGSFPETATPSPTSPLSQEKSAAPDGGREVRSAASPVVSVQQCLREAAESFELEEIQSFDEGSIAGSSASTPDPSGSVRASLPQASSGVVRTNSSQSDSSGFLEEPCVPVSPRQPCSGPGADLLKVLSVISGDSTDSQERSVDQQEFNCSDQHSAGRLFKHTGSTKIDSNTDTAKETPPHQLLLREGRAESLLQEGDQTDCLEDMDVVQKDIEHEDLGKSSTALGDSPPVVALEGDSQKEILKSDHAVFNMWSSSTHQDADLETVKVVDSVSEPSEINNTGSFLGRSVSVQMHSGLASISQSSLSKGLSHSPSFDPVAVSVVQPETDSSSPGSGPCTATDDRSDCSTPPLPELLAALPHARRSQQLPEGIRGIRLGPAALDGGLFCEEDGLLKGTLWPGSACCCSCDHDCRCCCQKRTRPRQSSASLPYTLDELESMMRCMRKFWRVLSEIEARLEEEQASVLNSVSDAYSFRAELKEVLELRAAVKQEAGMLEQQLSDLAHAYDDGIKMKLNRLLDEQSHLCAQLSITPSDTPLTCHAPTRSVAIQCCLLPETNSSESSLSHAPPKDTVYAHHSGRSPSSKTDKLHFVGFIKTFKDVSTGSDSLE